jgi:hypothetical protein
LLLPLLFIEEIDLPLSNIFDLCEIFNKTDKISQQPENCENRNDPDLAQAFLMKWWVESDVKGKYFLNNCEHLMPFPKSLVKNYPLTAIRHQVMCYYYPHNTGGSIDRTREGDHF